MTKLSAAWQSPSNIALVKYWGKKPGLQLPANASISFTLDQAVTNTRVALGEKTTENEFDLNFTFESSRNPKFEEKLLKFFSHIHNEFTFLKDYSIEIQSENTFPHSSGIASSASSMSALALCLCSIQEQLDAAPLPDFFRKASEIARIGSGSASRSIYGGIAEWGEHEAYKGSSDLYAIPYKGDTNPVFNTFNDTILIVEQGQKKVSSTVGHSLLHTNPFAAQRYATATANMLRMKDILKSGDLEAFTELVEGEALMLHALMMSSTPSFILMKPNTLEIIERIRDYRAQTQVPVLFTLDAGANVHMLYPDQYAIQVMDFVQKDLVGFCEKGTYFCNKVGKGPVSAQITDNQ